MLGSSASAHHPVGTVWLDVSFCVGRLGVGTEVGACVWRVVVCGGTNVLVMSLTVVCGGGTLEGVTERVIEGVTEGVTERVIEGVTEGVMLDDMVTEGVPDDEGELGTHSTPSKKYSSPTPQKHEYAQGYKPVPPRRSQRW